MLNCAIREVALSELGGVRLHPREFRGRGQGNSWSSRNQKEREAIKRSAASKQKELGGNSVSPGKAPDNPPDNSSLIHQVRQGAGDIGHVITCYKTIVKLEAKGSGKAPVLLLEFGPWPLRQSAHDCLLRTDTP